MKQQPSWYRPRTYRHFDTPCDPDQAEAASRPEKVRSHSFYPLIQRTKRSRRYKSESGTTEWKSRTLAYAAHRDSHIYARYAADLQAAYEQQLVAAGLESSVLAYRKLGMSNIQISLRVISAALGKGPAVLLGFDFSDFFGTLRHDLLKEAWQKTLGTQKLPEDHFRVFKSVTRYSTVDKDTLLQHLETGTTSSFRLCEPEQFRTKVRPIIQVHEKDSGIPQGLPISACLSNLYMLPFDVAMHALSTSVGGVYARYSDDVFLSLPPKAVDEAVDLMHRQLKQLSLSLNESKTVRRNYLDGRIWEELPTGPVPSRFDYLGLSFDGTSALLRDKTVARFMQRMARSVAKAERESKRLGADRLLFRRDLLTRFSHLGDRNFVRGYALNAAQTFGVDKVRRQLSRHAKILGRRMRAADARVKLQAKAPHSPDA